MEKFYSLKTCLKIAGGGMHPPLDQPLVTCTCLFEICAEANNEVVFVTCL